MIQPAEHIFEHQLDEHIMECCGAARIQHWFSDLINFLFKLLSICAYNTWNPRLDQKIKKI